MAQVVYKTEGGLIAFPSGSAASTIQEAPSDPETDEDLDTGSADESCNWQHTDSIDYIR